ncbi:uncharacterized protein I303_100075 [Kwoniella dejecticola CBS 10117]|uniref:Uncharacterized protein n=1 Tax=Kwoniella dejecticola CBS 10117 TaxID=1296121 RepID=A0A1A6ADZ9_9TREE|nr:uncharacterized protein I303_00075 [Kwoniella dejecticola CBS 10117]OBR88264.1 hypothetical protein I303_00075 [Kwoniella dejecticola CBS 10117]
MLSIAQMKRSKSHLKAKAAAKQVEKVLENFHRLHPVHYQILNILEREVPLTLMRTSYALYDDVVPRLFEKINIGDTQRCRNIIRGVDVDCIPDPDVQEEKDEDEEDNQDLPILGLKNHTLAHTKYLRLSDLEGTIHLIANTQHCQDQPMCTCYKGELLVPPIFPAVTHISLNHFVVTGVLMWLTAEAEYQQWDSDHRIDEIFICLAKHTSDHLNTICLHWPEEWDYEYWNRSLEVDSVNDHDEFWSIKTGLNSCLQHIKTALPNKLVIIHLDIRELVSFDILDNMVTLDLTLVLDSPAKWANLRVIRTLWEHFHIITARHEVDHLPFKYSLPLSRGRRSSVEDFGRNVKPAFRARFERFRKHIVFADHQCECYREDSD